MAQDLFSQLALQTLSEISAADSPEASSDDPVSAIIQVAQERGIDPAHLLGLAKLETQAGRRTVKGDGADTRNLFNVKDFSRDGNGIRARDSAEGSNDRYRQYGSYRESVEDLASLLERRYPGAARAGSPEEFARELKRGGYATDPLYERKLASTIRSSAGSLAGVRPAQPQEWDQGARYAPVGVASTAIEKPQPAEKPTKGAGFWEGAADVGLSTAQGVVGSVKALTDLAGADNAASRGLDDASKGLEKLKSDASQADRQYHQQKIKEAEASGDWKDEVAAYANMVWDMPLESLAQGIGSFATLGAGKVAQMAKLASAAKKAGVAKEAFLKTAQGIEAARKASDLGMKVNVGLGVGQGIGGVKGSQYEQTFNAAKESGLSDQQAQAMATEAQSYQQGWGQQALGAGLGYMAGKTGPIEKLATGKTVGAGGVARRFVGGGLIEAGTEGLQGGQERYAGNAAAIDAGVLDPSMQWAGVAGSGASEAITAGVLGGGAGALGRPDVDPQAQVKAAAQKSGGIASRAGLAANPGAQQQAAAAPAQPAAQQAATAEAAAQPAASQPAGSTAPAQTAQTAIQASALSAIEQALEADKQRRRAAGEVVEDDVTEGDVVAAVDPPAAVLPDPPGAQASTLSQPASAGFSLPAFDNSPLPKTDPAAAEEQRRQAAELEQKRKNRRAGTRAAVWERNPMLAFLGANGISRDAAGEFAPGLVERRKAFVPGYGPVFRPGAKNLDELVQTAKEDGFLREDDGEPELYDLIDRALRGERIAPLYADGAAEAEGQRRLQAMQERDGADFEDYLQQAEAEDFDPFPLMADSGYDEQDLAEIGQADVAVQNEVAALQQQYADLGFDPSDVLESLATQTENLSDQAYYDLAKSRFIQLIDQAYGQSEAQAEPGGGRAVRQPDGAQGNAQADGSAAGGQAAATVTPPAAPAAASPKRADAIRAKLDSLKAQGFSQFTRSGGRTLLLNPDTYETVELTPAEMAVAKAAAGQTRASLQSLRGQRKPALVDQQGADVLQSYTPADVLAQDKQAQAAQAQQAAEQQAAAAKAKADDERRRIEQASYAAADSFELGQNPLDSLTGQQDIFSAAPASSASMDVDVEETRAGLEVDSADAESLRGFLSRDIDPATGKPIHSQGRRNELMAELESLDGAIASAQEFLKSSGSEISAPVAADLAGERINDEWTAFNPQSGTLGIPRAEMPQIKAEHRGAMVNFLKARGIDGQQETIPAAAIKPTQAEFSPAKVKQAMDYQGGNRSIIVSADGYVVDGHHQWLAAREKGEPIPAIRLDQNIGDVLAALKDMPSAQPEQGGRQDAARDYEADMRLYPSRVLEQVGANGELAKLYAKAGVRGSDAFGGLNADDRAAAYAAFVADGGKPAGNLPQSYNDSVMEEERQIRRRQLQDERTINQDNGKPFKTAAGAKAMLDRFDLGDTHKIVSEGSGYALRQMPPAEQAEVRRKAEGRESYMEAQAAVIAEMGIPLTADGEIDATDEQWDEIDQRIAERLGRKPAPSAGAIQPENLPPTMAADEAPELASRWAAMTPVEREDVVRRAGWSTAKDTVNPTGRGIAKQTWADMVGSTRKRVADVMQQSDSQAPAAAPTKTEPAKAADPYPLVKHTTAKGKVLRGYIVRGMTKEQVKANIDEYPIPVDGGFFVREKHKDKLPKVEASKQPAAVPAPQDSQAGAEAGGFDSAAFDKARNDTIQASRDAGNTHLDQVPAYVETMRGKAIFYVHDPKVTGVIRTVDNNKNVYVDWSDAYSAEKEMASQTQDGKKIVYRSTIGPRDLKDYALAPDKREQGGQDATGQQAPVFDAYADALQYVDDRAKALGLSKKQFTTTDEYKSLYPQIKALYDAEKASNDAQRLQALKDAGLAAGDKVKTIVRGMFMDATEYAGTVVMRSGAPYVQIDGKMTVSRNGRLSETSLVRWDGRWTKEAGSQPSGASSDAGGQAAADQPIASKPFATDIEKTKTGWKILGDPEALADHARDIFGKGVVKRKDGISLATKTEDVADNFPARFDEYLLADLPDRHGHIEVRVNQDGSASVRSLDGGYMGPQLPSVAEAIANHRNEFGGSDSSIKQADAQPAGSTAAANEATKLKTIRDVADKLGMEYVSGLLADSLKKGQTFSMQGKQYTVTAVTDSRIRLKSSDGKNIEALKYGNKLVSGGNPKSQPYAQFVRDLEGVISVDLINENNPFHKPSEVFALAQKALDALPADMKEVRPEIAEPGIKPAKDLAGNKRDTAPTLEEVQAETAKSPLEKVEAELADWKRRRALPTNQAQVGVIDEEIAKLEAQVKAMREFEGQNDELDGKMQGYERKAQAEEAARYLKDFVYSLGELDGMTDRAQVLLSSPLGKSGRDTLLMKAFGLTREEAHDINNRLDSREPKKLRNVDMQEAFAMFPGLREMVDEAIQKTAGKQPAATVDADLEAIFDQLDGLTQRTQASGQQAAAAHPQAERIQFVQKHILDILQDLEDSGKVTINC